MFRLLLYPFSLIYGFIVSFRNTLFNLKILKSKYFNFPVISIGNITVGGTGKTPHVEYLTRMLQKEFKVSVLSRGYKRKSKGMHIASHNPLTSEIGDEPAQIKYKFPDIEVAVNANRVNGVEVLIERGNDLVILDDAFQHRYITPGLSILLVDFNRRIDNSYLLPFGNLRENASEIRRADIIIISKTPLDIKPIDRRVIIEQLKPLPYQELFFTGLKYGQITSVYDNNLLIPEDFYLNHEIYTILVVTGIAYSRPFIDYMRGFSADIIQLEFPDHSSYTKVRLNKIVSAFSEIRNENKIILTTEKDAVKLRELTEINIILTQNMYFIPVEVVLIDKEMEFSNKIIDYVRKNKRNNKVYSE
jgi:tetraacyldisaccharide 4'-kinase